MAPVKFDDLAKPANDVLNNDYQIGYQFKTKQKTSVNSIVATTAVDLWPAKSTVTTPGKLTFKIPKPFGIAGLSIDKVEVDKSGALKVESSGSCCLHNVKNLNVELKNNFKATLDAFDPTTTATYTGIADVRIQLDAPVFAPDKMVIEVTRQVPNGVFGMKCNMATGTIPPLGAPDLGARFAFGPLLGSLLLTKKLQCFSANACYKVSDQLKVAVAGTKETAVTGSVGVEYALAPETTLKAKVQQDQTLSFSVKHDVSKGFTLVGGCKTDPVKGLGGISYGLSLSVE